MPKSDIRVQKFQLTSSLSFGALLLVTFPFKDAYKDTRTDFPKGGVNDGVESIDHKDLHRITLPDATNKYLDDLS